MKDGHKQHRNGQVPNLPIAGLPAPSKRQRGQSPFDPADMEPFADHSLPPPLAKGGVAYRWEIFLPRQEYGRGRTKEVATRKDLVNLITMLAKHVYGFTVQPAVVGLGLDDEGAVLNGLVPIRVYTSANRAAQRYMVELKKLLERALGEQLVLIERIQVWIE